MDWPRIALTGAGAIGVVVAIVHGLLIQKVIVRSLNGQTERTLPVALRRLVPPLIQFSTFNWLIGGLALVIVAVTASAETRLVASILVGSSYAYGAIGNFYGVRGVHPGWILMLISVGLMVAGNVAA